MIFAYAVEPELIPRWAQHQLVSSLIAQAFGLGTSRVLLPLREKRDWSTRVYTQGQAADLDDSGKARLLELINKLTDGCVSSRDAAWELSEDWLSNAEREYDRFPFRGILATHNPRDHVAVITENSVGTNDLRWTTPDRSIVARNPAAVASALQPLLENALLIQIVSPYFVPDQHHAGILTSCIKTATRNAERKQLGITVHCGATPPRAGYPSFEAKEDFESAAAMLARDIPRGVEVQFRRWRQRRGGERFHNRYILTDIGGVTFGDELGQGQDGQTDNVQILTKRAYHFRWNQFFDDPAFDVVDEPRSLVGTGIPSTNGKAPYRFR